MSETLRASSSSTSSKTFRRTKQSRSIAMATSSIFAPGRTSCAPETSARSSSPASRALTIKATRRIRSSSAFTAPPSRQRRNSTTTSPCAKKRDHRKLGKELELFVFDDDVGPGLPMFLPRGAVIAEELEKLAKETEFAAGYQRVRTPHIARESLYKKSGHLPYYSESMFPPMTLVEDKDKKQLEKANAIIAHFENYGGEVWDRVLEEE